MSWLAWTIFGGTYLAGTFLAIFMTHHEIATTDPRGNLQIGICYISCFFWPFVAVAILVQMMWRG